MKMSMAVMTGILVANFALAGQESKPKPGCYEDGVYYAIPNSQVFEGASYQGETKTLTLRFTKGIIYEYYNVSRKTFVTFMKVDNKGEFFNEHIRTYYSYGRVPWRVPGRQPHSDCTRAR